MDEQDFAERLNQVNKIIEKYNQPVDLLAIAACLINEIVVNYDIDMEHVFHLIKNGIEYANEEEDDD